MDTAPAFRPSEPAAGSPDALADDLLQFVDAGPSPYHAVAEMAMRLRSAGFSELDEREAWSLDAGDRRFVIRDGGSLVAFVVGMAAPSRGGFRLVGAHTDSPSWKVRPLPDVRRAGYRLVGVEPYGSPLLHTWVDRDLTLAGRVAVRAPDGGVELRMVRLPQVCLRIPSLAIHLSRGLREEGLKLDPQRHMVPVWGPDDGAALLSDLARAAGVDRAAVLATDLVTADVQPATRAGPDGAYLLGPRLDNLVSCHAGLCALLAATDAAEQTRVLVANDHEEVGSASAEGARGPFLGEVLARVVAATDDASPAQALPVALARSELVSADMAHAVHPNYAERHEEGHLPRLGAGPVVKHNANQSYASDAGSAGRFTARCADVGVGLQAFVSRADLPCGSTIGPLTATRLGVATVDVGGPMLSMHSIREQCAADDVAPMVRALTAHLLSPV